MNVPNYSAEASAVLKTTEFIKKQVKKSTNNLILTDSLSTKRSLESTTYPTDMARIIQEKTNELKLRGISIIFIWVPGHINITGNEMTDKAAKEAAQSNNNNIKLLNIVTYDDIKTHNIKNKFLIKWQTH